MRITPADRKVINDYARSVRGLAIFSHCESAFRYLPDVTEGPASEQWLNLAYFGITTPEIGRTDLADFGPRLADLQNVEDHPSGLAIVDFYVYGRDRVGAEQQLDTNVQALWRNGRLEALHSTGEPVLVVEAA